MNLLAKARWVLALVVVASYPPSLLLWLAIHPFAAFWRRLGPIATYAVLAVPLAGYVAGVWLARDRLLGRDLGAAAVTLVLAASCLAAAFLLNRQRQKQLNFGNLSGIPELSREQYPGRLLTDGVYGLVRHPRYIEATLWVLAYAFFANYSGAYLTVVLCLPLMYAVVVVEERELGERFGSEYEAYCRQVPRFVPRLRSQKDGDQPTMG
jgi:protein-S-isoprenylcysteine O-methyltransferase Ste14